MSEFRPSDVALMLSDAAARDLVIADLGQIWVRAVTPGSTAERLLGLGLVRANEHHEAGLTLPITAEGRAVAAVLRADRADFLERYRASFPQEAA